MAREAISYTAPHAVGRVFEGHDADEPVTGFYRMRLRSGGVYVGVSIWHGLPLDPATGDEMDRAPCWNARINGEWANIETVWPRCAGDPIGAREYAHLCAQQDWGRKNIPDSAIADPTKRIDPLSSPMLF
jgi:hypothetical protein